MNPPRDACLIAVRVRDTLPPRDNLLREKAAKRGETHSKLPDARITRVFAIVPSVYTQRITLVPFFLTSILHVFPYIFAYTFHEARRDPNRLINLEMHLRAYLGFFLMYAIC